MTPFTRFQRHVDEGLDQFFGEEGPDDETLDRIAEYFDMIIEEWENRRGPYLYEE